jgi:hypothetical protein
MSGYGFVQSEKRFARVQLSKEEAVEKLENKLSNFWIVGCVLAIAGSCCIAYFQAFAASTSIAGFLDPNASRQGAEQQRVYLIVGIGISILGLLIGHLIHESIETDRYTDQKKIKPSFWLFIVLGAFYIGFQFVLAKTAGSNSNEGKLDYMPYVVAGLGFFELIIGAIVLEKAMTYILLFAINIILGFISRKMGNKSMRTNNYYRDYLTQLNAHNAIDKENNINKEGNENIRRAIAYYSNIKLEEGNKLEDSKSSELITPVKETNKQTEQEISKRSIRPVETRVVNATDAENHLESFLSDTTEDDLTA